MKKTSARFNIHGLSLEILADYPLLNDLVAEELRFFRIKKSSSSGVQLVFATLPRSHSDAAYPSRFSKYREISTPYTTPGTFVHRYARTSIIVINHLKERRMEAAIAPDPSLFPDPAFYCCLTQPISPWLKKKGLFFLHAGCVAENGQGILIIGHSQAGKSTLSLSAVKAGFKFFGDEQPILSAQNSSIRIHPFPRRIRLNRPIARMFPELLPLINASSEERLVFHMDDIWPKCVGTVCTPKVLIFPRFRAQGRMRLTRIHSSAALARLFQDDHFIWYQDGPWNSLSRRHLVLFERLANTTRAFELEYGNKDILNIPLTFRKLLE